VLRARGLAPAGDALYHPLVAPGSLLLLSPLPRARAAGGERGARAEPARGGPAP